jgi:hypothetical protein
VLDSAGHVILAGAFQGGLTFGGAALDGGSGSAFAAQLASSFQLDWETQFAGAGYLASAVDGMGNVFVAGTYPAQDGGAMVPCVPTASAPGAFVAQLAASSGACMFSTTLSVTPSTASLAINSQGVALLASAGNGGGIAVSTISAGGSMVGTFPLGTSTNGTATASSIAVDNNDNVYLVGSFTGTLDFGTGAQPLDSSGATAAFVVQLTPSLVVQWAVSLAGADPMHPPFVVALPPPSNQAVVAVPATGGTSFAAKVGPPPSDGGSQVAWNMSLGTMQVTALAVSPSGQTAFVGQSASSTIQVTVLDTMGMPLFMPPYSITGTGALTGTGVGFIGPNVAVVGSFSGAITAASLQSLGGNDFFFLEVCP